MTGDTHELQFKRSPAQKWFMGIYHRTSAPLLDAQKSFSNDSQGMYIVGPDGKSYGYTNDHDPSNIQEAMNGALKRYHADPPKTVEISANEIDAPFAHSPAPSTAVVRVYSRIRPVPAGCTWLNNGPGRDFLWVYQDEVKQMLCAPKPGCAFKLPAALALRMARYHLMDNVRGTPDMWAASEVKRADFTARITGDTPALRTISFEGRFEMASSSGRRGYSGRIEGEIGLDPRTAMLTRFRAYAAGKAFGDGTYTPNAPKGRYNLVVAMVEAHDNIARTVPPEAVSTENRDTAYHHPN